MHGVDVWLNRWNIGRIFDRENDVELEFIVEDRRRIWEWGGDGEHEVQISSNESRIVWSKWSWI